MYRVAWLLFTFCLIQISSETKCWKTINTNINRSKKQDETCSHQKGPQTRINLLEPQFPHYVFLSITDRHILKGHFPLGTFYMWESLLTKLKVKVLGRTSKKPAVQVVHGFGIFGFVSLTSVFLTINMEKMGEPVRKNKSPQNNQAGPFSGR